MCILTTSLTRDAIVEKDKMGRCSLSRQKNTASLDRKKKIIHYIKTVIQSRVPNMPDVEFGVAVVVQCQSHVRLCEG